MRMNHETDIIEGSSKHASLAFESSSSKSMVDSSRDPRLKSRNQERDSPLDGDSDVTPEEGSNDGVDSKWFHDQMLAKDEALIQMILTEQDRIKLRDEMANLKATTSNKWTPETLLNEKSELLNEKEEQLQLLDENYEKSKQQRDNLVWDLAHSLWVTEPTRLTRADKHALADTFGGSSRGKPESKPPPVTQSRSPLEQVTSGDLEILNERISRHRKETVKFFQSHKDIRDQLKDLEKNLKTMKQDLKEAKEVSTDAFSLAQNQVRAGPLSVARVTNTTNQSASSLISVADKSMESSDVASRLKMLELCIDALSQRLNIATSMEHTLRVVGMVKDQIPDVSNFMREIFNILGAQRAQEERHSELKRHVESLRTRSNGKIHKVNDDDDKLQGSVTELQRKIIGQGTAIVAIEHDFKDFQDYVTAELGILKGEWTALQESLPEDKISALLVAADNLDKKEPTTPRKRKMVTWAS